MEPSLIPLDRMGEGESGVVTQMKLSGSIRRRLQDLGLIDGTAITCCKRAPSGDPVAYWFRGTVVALRNEDARQIWILPCRTP